MTQNYRFGQIWSQNVNERNVYEFCYSELILYINIYNLFGIQKFNPKFSIWADLVPRFKYNLIFMKFGIQNREKMLILNILFGIDDLVPKFGPTMEVLSDFMKFVTKNKWNIQINILLPGLWANFILKLYD